MIPNWELTEAGEAERAARLATPVLVGELNPYDDRPAFALFDQPVGSAGERMRRLVCGINTSRYRAFSRHNLCVGKWSMPKAREAARHLDTSYRGRVLVLLGKKVQEAFGLFVEPYTVRGGVDGGTVYVALPHPSGLNRTWAEPGSFARARALLVQVCPSVPWGEAEVQRG